MPILVRPRDDDSGTVSEIVALSERLSLTFATPMMDRRAGPPRARARDRSNSTEIKSKYICRQFGAMSDLAKATAAAAAAARGHVGDRALRLMDDDGSDNGSDQRADSRPVLEFALSAVPYVFAYRRGSRRRFQLCSLRRNPFCR